MEHQTIDFKGKLLASSASVSSGNWIHAISARGDEVATRGTMVLSNSNNVTFGMSANTVTASVNTSAGVAVSAWPMVGNIGYPGMISNAPLAAGTSASTGAPASTQYSVSGCLNAVPPMHNDVHFNIVRGVASFNGAIASTASVSEGMLYGLYTIATPSTANLVSSWVWNLRRTLNGVDAQSIRWWWGTDSTSNSSSTAYAASDTINAAMTNVRWMVLSSGAGTLTARDYLIGHIYSRRTSSQNATAIVSIGHIQSAGGISFRFGQHSSVTSHLNSFIGQFSTTTNDTVTRMPMPGSIHVSRITVAGNRMPLMSFYSV